MNIHGATLVTVEASGPLLPAEAMTITPLSSAWKAPMAIGSDRKSGLFAAFEPMEIEMRSTPSLTASSMAFNRAEPEQPSSLQTL